MRFTSLAPPRLALSGAAIAIATATATATATLAALLAPGAAAAGSAQVGSSIGTYSGWDLDSASVTGTAWRDAVVVQTVNVSGDPAFANVQVGGGLNPNGTYFDISATGGLTQVIEGKRRWQTSDR